MPSAGENPERLKKVLNYKTQENLGEWILFEMLLLVGLGTDLQRYPYTD